MYGLSDELINQINNILTRCKQVNEVKIFGSRAMKSFEPSSDIDIVVFGDIDVLTVSKLKSELNELKTPYKFDVVHYESINNTDLKDHIDRVGKCIK